MNNIKEIYNLVQNHFLKYNYLERFNHSVRVSKMAKKLNDIHHLEIDENDLEVCALIHDVGKVYSKEELQKMVVAKYGFDEELLNYPQIFHSVVGPEIIKKYFPSIIMNEDMINAITYHTIGRPNMSNLEKVILIADEVEEGREFKEVSKLREITFESLDKGIVAMFENNIEYLKQMNKDVYSKTYETLEYYKGVINGRRDN